jgi:lipoprotein-releasing system ATP-binding protein
MLFGFSTFSNTFNQIQYISAMILASNISKSYQGIQVLKDISLQINQAEIVSIIGASGAGKSSLLQILGTLDKPDSGILQIANTNISQLSANQLADFRNKHIGFVFQFHQLLPEFTALENICMPAWIAGDSKSVSIKKANELLSIMGLADRAKHRPSELSGGEQQRVAVARALINEPSVVLADEPSGNLDSNAAKLLHELFFDLRKQFNQTFVIVTHNQQLAEMSDRMLTIKDGKINP